MLCQQSARLFSSRRISFPVLIMYHTAAGGYVNVGDMESRISLCCGCLTWRLTVQNLSGAAIRTTSETSHK